MSHSSVARTMGNEIIWPDVPLSKSLGVEVLGIGPDLRVMVGPIKIAKNPIFFLERMFSPSELEENTSAYQRDERIVAPNFIDEEIKPII